ncbi:MAG TPA: YraN family protein [Spirochaetota bacterium]|nr:YraN family protein [Spirochaetota bacterium]HPJ35457.1 YraN family protein [Spirochaetota bacterium]
MSDLYRKKFGAEGEKRAAAFLEENGFTVIEKNYRAGRSGEIDIIALKGELLVFAEVKSRSGNAFGGGIYSINDAKKRHLKTAAKTFLASHRDYDSKNFTYRFDLLLVSAGEVTWIDDIIR